MKKIYTIFVCLCLLAGFVACEKDKEFALTTLSINNEVITPAYNSADVRCSFKTDATISDAYVQYSLSSSFAKYDVAKMTEEKGIYAAQLVGLADNTTYYIRYEVSNKYSSVVTEEVKEFQTLQCTVPTIVLDTITDVVDSHAKVQIHLTFDGGASVTDMGVCWSTQANPTIEDIHKSTKDTLAVLDMTDLQPNTKYYIRAYAQNKVGVAYSEEKEFTTSTKPKYVDLGLPSGVKWATFNVGANSPEESGNYYAWGETSPKSSYTWLNYKWCEGSYNMLTKYNCDSSKGVVDYKTILDPEDDAATVNWGQGWRIPTKAEFDELIDNCTWTWSSINGVYGYEVKSNTNGNSIFLPSVGYYNDNTFQTYSSRYRSSSLGVNTPPYFLNFNASYIQIIFQGNQSDGYAIRPVSGDYAPDVPTVIPSNVIEITNTSVSVVCEIIRDGGLPIIECGVSYVEGTTTPIEWEKKIIAENNSTEYICHITGLKANTSYRVRAYAVNSKGTAYGSPVTFTTKEQSSTEPGVTETITVNGVSFKMVAVEGGTFTMGATSEQGSDAYSDESPTHSVTLSDFAIGETEVTQELWKAVMGSNPSIFSGTNLPVETVSWYDCQTFISKLNNLTGKNFRLPTEAEWEYAARGGNKSKGHKYAGSNTLGDVAWYYGNSSSKTHPVKQKQANELGLYDMSGNVWEWCQDWYGSYSSSAQTNPTGSTSGSYRVLRGGSWISDARDCRVSSRGNTTPTNTYNFLGLRLALGAAVELEVTLPTVTTTIPTQITETSVVAGGNVTSDGGAVVTERGVVYGKSPNPTISNLSNTIRPCGSGTGEFTYTITDLQENTTYYIRAYATNDVGTAYGEEESFTTNENNEISDPTGTENGYGYVDLGLSVKWATMNVGASKAEEYGSYFAWGETTTKDTYNWSTYKWCNGSETTLTKYCNNSSYGNNGFTDNKTQLELSDDAARANWGGSWRMPTDAEWSELINNCTWTWTTQYGEYGKNVTSKINGNSIFLPAAGYRNGSSLSGAGSYGYYWSSSLDTDNPRYAWGVDFSSSTVYRYYRYYGRSVRPVCP